MVLLFSGDKVTHKETKNKINIQKFLLKDEKGDGQFLEAN